MPVRKLTKYVMALPELEASRALDQVAVTAAGSGSMEESAQKQYVRDLRRAAAGGRRQNVQRATAASLALIGIKVETLPPGDQEQGVITSG